MNTAEYKRKTTLLHEIDVYLKAGGRQLAVAYVQNDRGEMVYTFSRPDINKENTRLEIY